MNEDTKKEVKIIIENYKKKVERGEQEPDRARFNTTVSLFTVILSRLDYLEEMLEFLVKEKKGGESH